MRELAGGGQKHYSALRVRRERAALWCSPLAAAFQPPKQAGHLGSLSLPWATPWSCLEKLQQKDLSRFLRVLVFEVSIAHVPKKRTSLQWMVAPDHRAV